MSPASKTNRTLDIEEHVMRFGNLSGKESSYRPMDMLLPRYVRDRYAVVGRPGEGTTSSSPLHNVDAFNITYLKCAPGKGIGNHAHETPEAFIVMSGRWSITLGAKAEQKATLEPWDIISVPPNEMHSAVNISREEGWLMTINAGQSGAKLFWSPELVEEIRATGKDVKKIENPGDSVEQNRL